MRGNKNDFVFQAVSFITHGQIAMTMKTRFISQQFSPASITEVFAKFENLRSCHMMLLNVSVLLSNIIEDLQWV